MPTLQELKASSPAYQTMSDADFAERVYRKHYADKLSFDDFKQRVGMASFAGTQSGSTSTEAPAARPDEPATTPAKPSLFRMDSDFRENANLARGNMLVAAAKDMFGGHDSAAKYLARKAGGRVDQDENGAPVVVLADGTRYRTNDPGLDSTDVANFTGNMLAFALPAAGIARVAQAKNIGLLGRSALQAVGAGTTDATLQAAARDGDVRPGRVAMAAAGGGGGEAAGTVLSQIGQRVAQGARSATGANRQAARNMLTEAGIPRTAESVGRVARGQSELAAGGDPRALLGREEFGLQYTQGQRILDPARKFDQLSREELLRQSPGGGAPLREAERQNVERVGTALGGMGERLGGKPGATPAELAQGAASRLREQADELGSRIGEAYERAGQGGRTAIDANSVRSLPDRLRAATADFSPNPSLTPAAAKTLDQIKLATDTILKGAEGGNVRGVTLKALETQRRIINNNIGAAANPTDRAAATAIKREFDRWLDEAVDGALISGDPQALQAIKDARGLRAEFGRRFEGGAEADKFIAGLLDGSRTPEELVNIALGAGQVSKASGARFVQRLKAAAGNDPEVIGQLRAAHFLRLTQDARGQPLTFGKLISNIRQTDYGNASVVKALYSPQEWAEIKRLADALEPLVAKGDFARSSGTGERLARMFFQRVGGGVPGVGSILKGVESFRDGIRANRALNQPLRLPGRSVPAVTGIGAATGDEFARPMEIDITGGTRGPAPTDEEMARLRSGMGR